MGMFDHSPTASIRMNTLRFPLLHDNDNEYEYDNDNDNGNEHWIHMENCRHGLSSSTPPPLDSLFRCIRHTNKNQLSLYYIQNVQQ